MARLLQEVQLEVERTTPAYRQRLRAGLREFVWWIALAHFGLIWDLEPIICDQVLAEFVQYMFDAHQPVYLARHAVVAIQTLLPVMHGRLHRSWHTVKSWSLQVTTKSRVPIPILILKAMVLKCLDVGLEGGRRAHSFFIMSVLLRIAFYGLLRPGELFHLLRSHIQIVTTDLQKVAIISIIAPKTRRVFGRSQYVLIKDSATVGWIEWLIEGLPLGTRIWPGDG